MDDEPSICNMVLRFLSMNNYQGEAVGNGKEAMKKLENGGGGYQIILTDIKMPEMDGITLMKVAKGINPDLLFIIMSGYGSLDSAIESMKMGALNFIKKPVSIVELISTIKKAEELLTSRTVTAKMRDYIMNINKTLEFTTQDLNSNLEMAAHYLTSDIRNFGLEKIVVDNITLALYEALSNAIEHGNLQLKKEISRENNLSVLDDFIKQKMKKMEIPEFANRKIKVEMMYRNGKVEFSVTDEGNGFDYNAMMESLEENVYSNQMKRGLFMIKNVMNDIEFNDKGNKIIMKINIF